MKTNNFRRLFFGGMMLLSMVCFVYMNVVPVAQLNAGVGSSIEEGVRQEVKETKQPSNLPDLEFVKKIAGVVAQFLPAK
jgi:asparagine N-glycosylation enzyme membrane subunit Stt3